MEERIYLVVVDETAEFSLALRHAARRAKASGGRVAMLSVVEPEGIESFGGIERALDDEAFDRARAVQASYVPFVREMTGRDPVAFFKKGEARRVLADVIEQEKSISALLLGARTQDGANNPLLQYFLSEKGLRKLRVPLVVITENCRCLEGDL